MGDIASLHEQKKPSHSIWLSVLIPLYNAENYLEQCVRSVLDQSDDRVEIILCEDCSTDRSRALARRLASENPDRLRLLENSRNLGVSASRNLLLGEARGEYLWFIDADDCLLPGAIAAVREAIERFNPDVVSVDYRKRWFYKPAFNGPHGRLLTDRDQFLAGVCGARKMYVWLRIVRREVWRAGPRFAEGRIFEDAALIPFLLLKARSLVHLRRAAVQYRVGHLSLMAQVKRKNQPFRLADNLSLAHSFDGLIEALDAEGIPANGTSRYAASHFLAQEFCKIARRIHASHVEGGEHAKRQLIAQFEQIMDSAAPIGFAKLKRHYLRKLRWIAWLQLARAMTPKSGQGMDG